MQECEHNAHTFGHTLLAHTLCRERYVRPRLYSVEHPVAHVQSIVIDNLCFVHVPRDVPRSIIAALRNRTDYPVVECTKTRAVTGTGMGMNNGDGESTGMGGNQKPGMGMGMGKSQKPGYGEKFNFKNFQSFSYSCIFFTLFIFYIFTNCERKTSVDRSTNIKQRFKQTVRQTQTNIVTFSNTDGEKSKVGDGELTGMGKN